MSLHDSGFRMAADAFQQVRHLALLQKNGRGLSSPLPAHPSGELFERVEYFESGTPEVLIVGCREEYRYTAN